VHHAGDALHVDRDKHPHSIHTFPNTLAQPILATVARVPIEPGEDRTERVHHYDRPMDSDSGDTDHRDEPRREDPRQGPFLIAFLGAVAVALILLLPISVPDPDGPAGVTVSCGSAASISTDWRNLNTSWRLSVHDACTDRRVTRIAEAAGAVSLTLVVATFLLALPAGRRRRKEQPAMS
jgi:hypothetical protein